MNKLKKSFLTNYIDINRDGDIIFRSVINLNIIRNVISKKAALVIIYESLHEIKSRRIDDIFTLDNHIIPQLIKEHEKNPNKAIFADGNYYHDEINTVIAFLNELSKNKNISVDVIKKNCTFLKLSDNHPINNIEDNKIKKIATNNPSNKKNNESVKTNYKLDELITPNQDMIENEDKSSDYDFFDDFWLFNRFDAKKIKKSLNQFNKDELCYILNINPDCCLEKEKSLKNDIVQTMRNKTFKMKDIDNLSHDELKNFYFGHIGKNNINKEQIKEYVEKIKSFNKLYFYEMYDEKEYAIELKRIIDGYAEKNDDIDIFKKYFNFITNETLMKMYFHLRDNPGEIKEFTEDISNYSFYNYEIRHNLLCSFENLNQSYFEIMKLDKSIRNKIYYEVTV